MSEYDKPCPFCGHTVTYPESESKVIPTWFLYCPQCGSRGPIVYMHHRSAEDCKRHARSFWNTRASEMNAHAERLRGEGEGE